MTTLADAAQSSVKKTTGALTGAWQRIAVAAWALIFLTSLLSSALSIAHLNQWDQISAADLPQYFPEMTQENITRRGNILNAVADLGFSLPAFANLLTVFRVAGSLALFVLSALLARRYPRSLMALTFASLLAVMGATGIWQNTMFGWATMLTPWMKIPTQVLNILLWFGLIFLYVFPDGRFTPRWTKWLVILLVPIAVSMIFNLPVFFNPRTWPAPLALLPNLVFVGAALASVLTRYRNAEPELKVKLRGWVTAGSMLMILYFIMFFMNNVYAAFTGQGILTTDRQVVLYVLINEPLWFLLEVAFVVLTARSIFRHRLLERY